jgi:hypothetical protein
VATRRTREIDRSFAGNIYDLVLLIAAGAHHDRTLLVLVDRIQWGDIDWHNRLIVFRRSSTPGQGGPNKSGRKRRCRSRGS